VTKLVDSTPTQPTLLAAEDLEMRRKQLTEPKRFAEFIAKGPLYTQFVFDEVVKKEIVWLPSTIELHCTHPTCSKVQTFARHYVSNSQSHQGVGNTVVYECRNCGGKRQQKYMYVWNDDGFWKVGQVPELVEEIEPKLNAALGDSRQLYKRALRSRSFGFGIGSVSYLRRIIEDTTDNLMDLLKADKWDGWSEQEKAEFEDARQNYQYSRKIEYAAEKVLPKEVFADGRDSFTALHDVTSHGLHGLSEEQCIAIFDRCNLIFSSTFRILAEHKRERDEFAAQLRALKR
jgi:hypothetical protein